MFVNGPLSPKQCYYETDYLFYSFYWSASLEIWLDHYSTYYRSLSKNSDVKRRISHCDPPNLQYKKHPEFWPSHRRIFKMSLYHKTHLILETRRYMERSLLIFRDVTLKNGRLAAILDFSVSRLLTLVWLWISSPNFSNKLLVYMERSLFVGWLPSDRPTWDMKNILYIWFSHFTSTETHRC